MSRAVGSIYMKEIDLLTQILEDNDREISGSEGNEN